MKKVLITGGLGYIGMELAKVFSGLTRKYQITVLDSKFYSSRINQLKIWGISYKQLDILDAASLQEFIKDFDVVYHLAGITDVPQTKGQASKELNQEIKKVGIDGTRNILNYTKKDCKIVFPSTHVVFEGLKTLTKNLDEFNEPVPILEYSKSKYQSEKDIINSGKKYIILRLGSVYGNSFDSTRLNIMANLFAKITSQNGTISLFGGGKQLKSLVNIVDVARAMQFVGENDNVYDEIFHLSNETITVKQVADACKKINNKIKIISTNDDVPNLGYGLNSDKIKKLGFKYLYNLPNSLKEMYSYWKDIDILKDNEVIVEGRDNYSDSRGVISNYYFEDPINMIGAVDSVKGSIRGNHYHPIQTQKCLLVSGSYVSLTKDLLDENSVVETLLVKSGELSIIPPNVAHTMIFLEDSVLLNLVTGEREHDNYGITHTMKYELVDKRLAENILESYKTECRVCESQNLEPYIKLGLSPLANNLLEKKEDDYDRYPLEVNFCSDCFNSQLSVAVPSKKMFDNYLYLSSTTDTFKLHFEELAKKLKMELNLTKQSLVVDIGSNDGIFLKPLLDYGIEALGVEPAKNVAKIANKNGVKTVNRYFDEKCIKKISSEYGKADVVTAFNVFAHADNLKGILNNVSQLLKKDGVFVFEVQYLLRTISDLTFDNIYHEHFNYWCLLSLQSLFKYSDLNIYKVEEVDTHGGSLRVYASKNQNVKLHSSVKMYISLELDNKLNKLKTYKNFGKKVEKIKLSSLKKVNKLLNEGKTIIGYAAPAKATTVLNYFGIGEKEVQFTIDDNSLKHEKYIPGAGIKIISSHTENLNYDYVLVLAWNFFDAIVKNNKNRFSKSKFIKLK